MKTYAKILSLFLVVLMIFGSVLAVSATTPPYSENFTSGEDMLDALRVYAEQYPDYNRFQFRYDTSIGYHREYRQVRSVAIGVSGHNLPASYGFMESSYSQGIDITATEFESFDGSERIVSMVYYGYNPNNIKILLYNAKRNENVARYDEGVINGREYLVCKNADSYTDMYLVDGECLVWLRAFVKIGEDDIFKSIDINYHDLYIPVMVEDSDEWFAEAIDKEYTVGDSNSDGELNIKDATALQKYLAKISQADKLTSDFNGDLKIDIKDVSDIQKMLAGLKYTSRREKYPVTTSYSCFKEEKYLESTTDYAGTWSNSELQLHTDFDDSINEYATVFNSVEEFEAFFGKTLERFDEKFFEENALVYLYRQYPTGSVELIPRHLSFGEEGVLYVWFDLHSLIPDGAAPDCVIGTHNLYYEVKKTDIEGIKGICLAECVEAKVD